MAVLDIKFNINGEIVELKDLDKVVKALTKKQRDEIDKLKKDIVSIDKQKVIAKKFELVGNESMRKSLNLLTSGTIDSDSAFSKMLALPVGMQASEFITYLDVKISPGMSSETTVISAEPIQVATAAKWQSKSFSSRVSSVTDSASSTDVSRFRAGTVKLLIQDNSIASAQGFNSKVSSVVGGGVGTFNVGRFYINNKPIDLVSGNNLNEICSKINSAGAGVKATVGENITGPQFKLTLKSEKFGAEHFILIDDPNGIFTQLTTSGGEYFIPDPQYETLTLAQGDTLDNIAYKINKFESTTNLRADVFQIGRGQYTLILKSLATGIDNAFQIIDKDSSNTDVILTGSNSGQVFENTFNSTIAVTSGTKASVTEPQNAKLMIDGTEIQSPVNSFEVYNGIDVIVKSPSSKLMAFEVKHDINAIFVEINNLVDKYNLFRQIYLDSISNDKKSEVSQLEKNNMISSAMQNMSFAFQEIEFLDIGITKGTLELETEDGDKKIKKDYKNMILLDKSKLIDKLTDDPEKIRNAFDVSFNSSSSNFIKPIVSKKISINNKPLGTNKIDMELAVDESKLRVRSKSSRTFSDPSNVVDPSGNDKSKFKTGIFWINGSAVTITNGMSLASVVSAINDVSNMSRISAANNVNYISFTQYGGGFSASDDGLKFQRMNIYDPNNVLQNTFSVVMETGTFNESDLSSLTVTFSLNGVSISSQGSVNDLINKINNKSIQTGVTANAIATGGGNYYIQFITNRLQDIVIDNSGGGLGSITLPTVEPQQNNNYFFDTSAALTSSVKVSNKNTGNPMVLIMNGSDIKGGGTITPLNINNGGIKIDNLEVLFIGDQSDSATISISEGLAANLTSQLDEMFKLQQGYKGSTSGILQVNHELSKRKDELEKIIKNKEDILKSKEKILLNKFAKAQAQVDEGEAYINMIKEMMKKND